MPNSTKRNLYPNVKILGRGIRKLQRAKVGLEALNKVEMAVGYGAATENIRELLIESLNEAGTEIAEVIRVL